MIYKNNIFVQKMKSFFEKQEPGAGIIVIQFKDFPPKRRDSTTAAVGGGSAVSQKFKYSRISRQSGRDYATAAVGGGSAATQRFKNSMIASVDSPAFAALLRGSPAVGDK